MQPDREVIDSVKHPLVAEARRRAGQPDRPGTKAYLVDGLPLVSQALDAAAPIERLFFLHPPDEMHAAFLERAQRSGVECLLVTRGVFFRILGLGYETAVRVIALVRRPAPCDVAQLVRGQGCILVGERIQDPRNVGVMVRTADAWGLAGAVFSQDSADPWCRASVRSTTGSVFRVPVTLTERLGDDIERLEAQSIRVVGTSAHAERACWEVDLTGPCAVVFGNESDGLSPELKDACDLLVRIPMWGGAHSLNVTVAAGILLYERARQQSARQ
jgi:TrmH family RNA methyltransferase